MKAGSRVLAALARLYERSQAGRTGLGDSDFQPRLEELLAEAGCSDGDARELAERELRALNGTLLTLEFAHKRSESDIYKVRLPRRNEADLYRLLGCPSPTEVRSRWSALFRDAEQWSIRERHAAAWKTFCADRGRRALHWQQMGEFRRDDLERGRELLQTLQKLVNWQASEHFLRAASCRICGESKQLERQRGVLERLLAEATAGQAKSFAELGILETPRHVLVSGPLRLRSGERVIDLRGLRDGVSLSAADIESAEVECTAKRCVTVENKTSFHQRALEHPEDLHVHTSYPGAAALALLRKLRPEMHCFHFGDTDPAGFDILRELREASGRSIESLGMECSEAAVGRALTREEVALLRRLIDSPALATERPLLLRMVEAGHKGQFEQEHRAASPRMKGQV